VDLDLAQVRAFVMAADHLHFGQAAKDLFLTQQALSARIARLEDCLGVKLFNRGARGVKLTAEGRQFLNSARQVLMAGDHAVASARHEARSLRMNVWGHLFFPAQTVRALAGREPKLRIDVSTCQNMSAAITALHQSEIDLGFGRVTHCAETDTTSSGTLARRLVRFDAMAVIVNVGHPLAHRAELSPNDLRSTQLWLPAPLESLDFLRQFVERFELRGTFGGLNLGPHHILDLLHDEPGQAAVVPAHLRSLEGPSIRLIPLVNPTPLYGSSLLWRKDEQSPKLGRFLQEVDVAIRQHSWLRYDKQRHWLPRAEQEDISALTRPARSEGTATRTTRSRAGSRPRAAS
jgi:DNA-binding transcriptional LysR family regulator